MVMGGGLIVFGGRLVLIPRAGSDRLFASSKLYGRHGGGKNLICLSF